jgi:hypothetical protein
MKIQALSFSDVHLGHDKNTAKEIGENIERCFPLDRDFSSIDFLFLVGDWTDKEIKIDSPDSFYFFQAINHVCLFCKINSIALRVLYGTPSHEERQPQRFAEYAKKHGIDFKLYSSIDVEQNTRFGVNILYIPDVATPSTYQTLQEARAVMASRAIERVDYVLLHGTFDYQVPPQAHYENVHDSNAYLELCQGLILTGHEHPFNTNQRILNSGSFDRLCHGDEIPKGYIYSVYDSVTHDFQFTFIENTHAKKFLTVDATRVADEKVIEHIDSLTARLPVGSYVRVLVSRDSCYFASPQTLIENPLFVDFVISVENKDKKPKKKISQVLKPQNYSAIEITCENILQLMRDKLVRAGFDAPTSQTLLQLLEENK